MLHLIPKPLHRRLYRVAHRLRIYYWRITRPTLRGCAMIAQNEAGEVLLVRPSYGKQVWQWPGGGIGANEDAVAAASREVAEETGLRLEEIRTLGESRKMLYGATNVVHIFGGLASGTPRGNGREILEAEWFAIDKLPNRRSIYVDEFLFSYRAVLQGPSQAS